MSFSYILRFIQEDRFASSQENSCVVILSGMKWSEESNCLFSYILRFAQEDRFVSSQEDSFASSQEE